MAGWFWRLTHPRVVRAEKQCRQQQLLHQSALLIAERQQQWQHLLEQAQDTTATPHQLRHLASAYRARVKEDYGQRVLTDKEPNWIPVIYTSEIRERYQQFENTISAHPNLPLDVFGNDLMITTNTVGGLLCNPICPLILLEQPDFLEKLDFFYHQKVFARYVLQHEVLPSSLLRALMAVPDPWMALEARTHVSAPEMQATISADNPEGIPDLEWVDQQVIALLRKETANRRSLLCELEHHGLISQAVKTVDPWREPAFQALRDAVPIAQVEAFVRERRATKLWKRKNWEWKNDDRYGEGDAREAFFMEGLAHPDMPLWVADALIGYALRSPYRLTILQRSDVSQRLVRKCRQQAIDEALDLRQFPESEYTCPGTVYLVLRDLPEPMRRQSESILSGGIVSYFEKVLQDSHCLAHFLARLAVALRLDDADAEQQKLRLSLVDDPNRYIRAAARKEIAWPRPVA